MNGLPITELHNAAALYGNAVVKLATEDGDLRERLTLAYSEAFLVFAVPCTPNRTAVPHDLQRDIWAFNDTMTQRPAAGDEGTTSASVQLMDEDEVRGAAHILIDLAMRLTSASALALQ